MPKTKTILSLLIILLSFFHFMQATAQVPPLVPCGRVADQTFCRLCHLIELIKNLVDYALLVLVFIGVLMIMVTGVFYIVSVGSKSTMEKAKESIKRILIGFGIVLLAWLIVNYTLYTLSRKNNLGITRPAGVTSWHLFNIICEERDLPDAPAPGPGPGDPCVDGLMPCVEAVWEVQCADERDFKGPCRCADPGDDSCTDIDEWCADHGGIGRIKEYQCIDGRFVTDANQCNWCAGVPGAMGNCEGVNCAGSKNFCGGSDSTNCCQGTVNSWNTQITQGISGKSICGSINTESLVKAIMAKESCGNVRAVSPAGACGLMQLLPATANSYKSTCGVSENITCSWLTNSANAAASICIATAYMQSLSSSCGCDVSAIAAGYNGGAGACARSNSCANCTMCEGHSYTAKWQCLWDNSEHTQCNTGYQETRNYTPRVNFCYGNF